MEPTAGAPRDDREPLWWHEPWAVGALLVLAPPLGLLAAVCSREVGRASKAALTLALLLLASVVGSVEYVTGGLSSGATFLLAAAYTESADSLMARDRYGEAERMLRRAAALEPMEARPRAVLGDCLARQGRLEPARVELAAAWSTLRAQGAEASDHSVAETAVALADLLLTQGRATEAKTILEQARGAAPHALEGARYELVHGRLLLALGERQAARNELRRVTNGMQARWLGEAYERLADVAAADGDRRGELCLLGEALRHREGNRALEVRLLERGQALGVDAVPLRAYLRTLRFRRSDVATDVAPRVLERIVERHPDFPLADACLYTAAWVHATRLKNDHRAAELYEKVAAGWPKGELFTRALWQAAGCYQEVGLPKHRERCLKRLAAEADEGSSLRIRARVDLARLRYAEGTAKRRRVGGR